MKTLGILAFAILLPALAYHPHRPRVQQASSDDEMYEVYSAAIKELYLNEGEKAEGSTGMERLVVIRDRTTSPRWGTQMFSVKMSLITGISIDSETIEDLHRKSKNAIHLEPRFEFAAKQVLIGDEEFFSFFGGTGGDWPGFFERYPTSVGWVSLSPVGFNRDHNEALLYIARHCGFLCGEGYSVALVKNGGAWSVKGKFLLWVS